MCDILSTPGICGNYFNTLRPRQNGHYFADDISKCIFLNGNAWILLTTSPKFPKAPIKNITALVEIMAWHQPDSKPLSELLMVRLLTHICVNRPQGVKSVIFKLIAQNNSLGTDSEIALMWMLQNLTHWWLVIIGSGDAWQHQAITWTTLTQIYIAIWRH